MKDIDDISFDGRRETAVISSVAGGATDAEDLFANDEHLLFFLGQNVHVAVVCDVLDALGYRQQAMHHRLRPLLPDIRGCGFAGRARTFRWMRTDYVVEDDPYGVEIEGLDSLQPNDVVVHSTDPDICAAPWGELMTTVAMKNGAVGCVCDGGVRDTVKIIDLGFPVYYSGVTPLDSKGRCRVMDYDVPVRCGDVLVNPGEIVFADYDGIVVVPREVEQIALRMALDKMTRETHTREALGNGKRLREVYDKYGVL